MKLCVTPGLTSLTLPCHQFSPQVPSSPSHLLLYSASILLLKRCLRSTNLLPAGLEASAAKVYVHAGRLQWSRMVSTAIELRFSFGPFWSDVLCAARSGFI